MLFQKAFQVARDILYGLWTRSVHKQKSNYGEEHIIVKQEFHVKNCITNRQTSSNKRKYTRIYLCMIMQGMALLTGELNQINQNVLEYIYT